MIETIVVGYDGSAVGDRALTRTSEIAAAFKSSIVLVVVDDIPVIAAAPVGMAGVADVEILAVAADRDADLRLRRSVIGQCFPDSDSLVCQRPSRQFRRVPPGG